MFNPDKYKNQKDYLQKLKRLSNVKQYDKKVNQPLSTLKNFYEANDGKAYGIIKENNKFYIKESPIKESKDYTENDFDYIGGLKNKAHEKNIFSDYNSADRDLNFRIKQINEDFNFTYPSHNEKEDLKNYSQDLDGTPEKNLEGDGKTDYPTNTKDKSNQNKGDESDYPDSKQDIYGTYDNIEPREVTPLELLQQLKDKNDGDSMLGDIEGSDFYKSKDNVAKGYDFKQPTNKKLSENEIYKKLESFLNETSLEPEKDDCFIEYTNGDYDLYCNGEYIDTFGDFVKVTKKIEEMGHEEMVWFIDDNNDVYSLDTNRNYDYNVNDDYYGHISDLPLEKLGLKDNYIKENENQEEELYDELEKLSKQTNDTEDSNNEDNENDDTENTDNEEDINNDDDEKDINQTDKETDKDDNQVDDEETENNYSEIYKEINSLLGKIGYKYNSISVTPDIAQRGINTIITSVKPGIEKMSKEEKEKIIKRIEKGGEENEEDQNDENGEQEELQEKAKSKDQQQAAGIALAAKKGEKPVKELKGASKEMYDSMSKKELEDYAETKHDKINEKFSLTRKDAYVISRDSGKEPKEAAMEVLKSRLPEKLDKIRGDDKKLDKTLKTIADKYEKLYKKYKGKL